MTKKSSEIDTLAFLDLYEKHDCLWDFRCVAYKDKNAKNGAYDSIIKELNITNWTPQGVKLKIKSIRTAYIRELANVQKHSNSYEPKLFWFKKADSFLRAVSYKKYNSTLENFETDQEEIPAGDVDLKDVEHKYNISLSSYENVTSNGANNAKRKSNEPLNNSNTVKTYVGRKKSRLSNAQYLETPTNQQENGNILSPTVTENSQECTTAGNRNDDNALIFCNTVKFRDKSIHREDSRMKPNISPPETSRPPIQSKCNSNNSTTHDDLAESTSSSLHIKKEPDPRQSYSNQNQNEDEWSTFCKYVEAQLRAIKDPSSKSIAKLKIQEVLCNAEMGMYVRSNFCASEQIASNAL